MTVFTEESIERAIYTELRKETVLRGFLPDVVLYPTVSQFNTQIAAIEAQNNANDGNRKKEIIQVIGESSFIEKGAIQGNRIVLTSREIQKGSLGFRGYNTFTPVLDDEELSHYELQVGQEYTNDLTFKVTVICARTYYKRLMNSIVHKALGINGRKAITTAENKVFEIDFEGSFNTSGEDFIEIAHNYRVKDVLLSESAKETITPIREITGFVNDLIQINYGN